MSDDIKKDILVSLVVGGIAFIVGLIFTVAAKSLLTELKQPEVILFFDIGISIFVLFALLIRRHLKFCQGIAVITAALIASIILGWFFFDRYAWRGLPSATDAAYFVVLYPEWNFSFSVQTSVESAMRLLPIAIKGTDESYKVYRIALPKDFEFDSSLLKRRMDKSDSVIGYINLLPSEGEKIHLKYGFPAAQPFLKLGLQLVQTDSYENQDGLGSELKASWDHFSVRLRQDIGFSKMHYGISKFSIEFTPYVNYSKITYDQAVNSALYPLGDKGMLVDADDLTGNIYFALVKGLISYYKMTGTPEDVCRILDGYLSYDKEDNAKNNLKYLPQDDLLSCLKASNLENKSSLLKTLPKNLRNDLQHHLFWHFLKRRKSLDYLVGTGLFEDRQVLEIADKFAFACQQETSQRIETGGFAVCLQDQLAKNIGALKQHPQLRLLSTAILHDFYDQWLIKQNLGIDTNPDAPLIYVKTASDMYRSLGQQENACELDWENVNYALLRTAFLQNFKAGDDKSLVKLTFGPFELSLGSDAGQRTELALQSFEEQLQEAYRISQCQSIQKVMVFDVNIRPLLFESQGRAQLIKLLGDVGQDFGNDTSLAVFLDHLKTNFLFIVSYIDKPELRDEIRSRINAFSNKDPDAWLKWGSEYLESLDLPQDFLEALSKHKNDKEFSQFQGLTFNDKVSLWHSTLSDAIDAWYENNIVKSELAHELSSLEGYFYDPFMRVYIVLINDLLAHNNGGSIHRYNMKLRHGILDKMILLRSMERTNADKEQLHADLLTLKKAYAESEPAGRIKHYELLVSYKLGNTKEAIAALSDLITTTSPPYTKFYQFAKSVLESPGTVAVCPDRPDSARKILDHLLLKGEISEYWNWHPFMDFNHALESYLRQVIVNEKNGYPELVAALVQCNK